MIRSRLVLPLLALLICGPFLVFMAIMARTGFVRWGADCTTDGRILTCERLFGIWDVNPDNLSHVGLGYGFGFSLLWAVTVLAVLIVIGLIAIIIRAAS